MNQVNRGSLLHLLLSRGQIWLPNMAIHGIRCRIANPKKHRVNYSYTDAGPVRQNDRDLPSYPSHLQRLDLKQHSFLDLGAELTLVLCCLSHRSGFQDLALHLITRCYQTWLENNLLDPFSSMGFHPENKPPRLVSDFPGMFDDTGGYCWCFRVSLLPGIWSNPPGQGAFFLKRSDSQISAQSVCKVLCKVWGGKMLTWVTWVSKQYSIIN